MADIKLEVWLRGPIEGVPFLLQPVAHALFQAKEEVNELMKNFPEHQLWTRPAGVASVGFHLQHLTGVLDRLFTYARGESLSLAQLQQLKQEGKETQNLSPNSLVTFFNTQVDKAIKQLMGTDEKVLTDVRGVGRAQVPSTVLGLLVHAAEHTMRHLGQLLVTVRILNGETNY